MEVCCNCRFSFGGLYLWWRQPPKKKLFADQSQTKWATTIEASTNLAEVARGLTKKGSGGLGSWRCGSGSGRSQSLTVAWWMRMAMTSSSSGCDAICTGYAGVVMHSGSVVVLGVVWWCESLSECPRLLMTNGCEQRENPWFSPQDLRHRPPDHLCQPQDHRASCRRTSAASTRPSLPITYSIQTKNFNNDQI